MLTRSLRLGSFPELDSCLAKIGNITFQSTRLVALLVLALLLLPTSARSNAYFGAQAALSYESLTVRQIGTDWVATAFHDGDWGIPINPNIGVIGPPVLHFHLVVDGVEVNSLPFNTLAELPGTENIFISWDVTLTPGHHDIEFYASTPWWDETEGGPPNGIYFDKFVSVDIP